MSDKNKIMVKDEGNFFNVVEGGNAGDVLTQTETGEPKNLSPNSPSSSSLIFRSPTTPLSQLGSMQFNESDQVSSTEMYASKLSKDGQGIGEFEKSIKINDGIYLMSQTNPNKTQYWGVTSTTDQTSQVTYGVELIDSTGIFDDTEIVFMCYIHAGFSSFKQQVVGSSIEGGGAIPVLPNLEDKITFWDDSTKNIRVTDFELIKELFSSPSVVPIMEASDFGVIDSTKIYLIEKHIDMTGVTVEVPAGGIFINGYTAGVSSLYCSDDNHTVFTSAVGGCGTVSFQNVGIMIDGANSMLADLTAIPFSSISFRDVVFTNVSKIGIFDSFFQGLELDTFRTGGTPTIELKGAWSSGYRVTTSLTRFLDPTMTEPLFKAGTGFVMQSRFLTDMNLDLPALAPFFDFSPTNFPNPSTLRLFDCEITRNGVYNAEDTNITPNIDCKHLSSQWDGNQGICNTFVGGKSTVTTEITTPISLIGVFYDLLGTYTSTNLEHFDDVSSGMLRHLGNNPREFIIPINFTLDSGSNDQISLKTVKWDDSLGQFEDIDTTTRQVNSLVGPRDVVFFNYEVDVILNKNDYIKFQVANLSSTANITIDNGSNYRARAR